MKSTINSSRAAARFYVVQVTITIRSDVEGQPVGTGSFLMPREFTRNQLDALEGMTLIRDKIVKDLVGKS